MSKQPSTLRVCESELMKGVGFGLVVYQMRTCFFCASDISRYCSSSLQRTKKSKPKIRHTVTQCKCVAMREYTRLAEQEDALVTRRQRCRKCLGRRQVRILLSVACVCSLLLGGATWALIAAHTSDGWGMPFAAPRAVVSSDSPLCSSLVRPLCVACPPSS